MVIVRNLLLGEFTTPRSLKKYFHEQIKRIKGVDNIMSVIDFEPILFKLIHEEKVHVNYAVESLIKYIQFLILCKENQGVSNVPTEQIDAVWHLHILDTQKYPKDCKAYLGYFLHHFPYFGIRSKRDAKNLEKGFNKTQKLFLKIFGESITMGNVMCGGAEATEEEKPVKMELASCEASACAGTCYDVDEKPKMELAVCNGGSEQKSIRPNINTLFKKTA